MINPLNRCILKAQSLFKTNIGLFATLKTRQTSYIGDMSTNEIFTRELLRRAIEEPDYDEKQRKILEDRLFQEREQRFFNLKANDKNAANYVKVKLNNISQQINENEQQQMIGVESRQPFTYIKTPRKPKILIQGKRKLIRSTVKKLVPLLRFIRRKHVYDAIDIMSKYSKKAAKYIILVLRQVVRHATDRGIDSNRLYISEAIAGKHLRTKSVRYHAKGRGSYMIRDISQLTIKLEEKPVEELFKQVVQGRTPPMLAWMFRREIHENDLDYDILRKNQFILTAKGRQQKRLMLKRKAILKHQEFKAQGINVPSKLIYGKLVDEEAKAFSEKYIQNQSNKIQNSFSQRQALFNKNEKLSG